MIALIDGDIIAYRCAASCKEDDPSEIAILRADKLMRQILEETQSDSCKTFLSGSSNFRYDIYPEYKANRKDAPRPPHLQPTREFLVTEWNAEVCDGIEADDALGINQTEESIVCSIDKDLLQVPGRHYNFVRSEESFVTNVGGLRTLYKQIILGDKTDNVPGFDGKFRQKAPKFVAEWFTFIDDLETEVEMYDFVCGLYKDKSVVNRNATLLYVLREEGKQWEPPIIK